MSFHENDDMFPNELVSLVPWDGDEYLALVAMF
jgi:hypothetical protein